MIWQNNAEKYHRMSIYRPMLSKVGKICNLSIYSSFWSSAFYKPISILTLCVIVLMLSLWKTGTFMSLAPSMQTFKYKNGSYCPCCYKWWYRDRWVYDCNTDLSVSNFELSYYCRLGRCDPSYLILLASYILNTVRSKSLTLSFRFWLHKLSLLLAELSKLLIDF